MFLTYATKLGLALARINYANLLHYQRCVNLFTQSTIPNMHLPCARYSTGATGEVIQKSKYSSLKECTILKGRQTIKPNAQGFLGKRSLGPPLSLFFAERTEVINKCMSTALMETRKVTRHIYRCCTEGKEETHAIFLFAPFCHILHVVQQTLDDRH
jgi:hypothetical protein